MEKLDFTNIKPSEVMDLPQLKEQFINILTKMHKTDQDTAEATFDRERGYFTAAYNAINSRLKYCTSLSIFSAFLEIAVLNVSIQPGSKSEAYMEARSAKTGQKDAKGNDVYITSAVLVLTAYGELALRIRAGHLIRMANPVVIYEGDVFQPGTNDRGEMVVRYQPAIPRQSKKIIGCYVAIYLPHNLIDFKYLLIDDVERLKERSAKQNRESKANALYSSYNGQIDPGFLETKTMKHAMKTLPKLRTSASVTTETDMEIEDEISQQQDMAPAMEYPSYGAAQQQDMNFRVTTPANSQNDNESIF